MPAFSDLPPELRLDIYKLALIPEDGVVIPETRFGLIPRPFPEPRRENVLSLFFVSRPIYEEARPVFYGSNVFRVESRREWVSLLDFLICIGTRNRAALKRIEIDLRKTCLRARRWHDPKLMDDCKSYEARIWAHHLSPKFDMVPYLPEAAAYAPIAFEGEYRHPELDVPYAPLIDPAMFDCVELLSHQRVEEVVISMLSTKYIPSIHASQLPHVTNSWLVTTALPLALEDACLQLGTTKSNRRVVQAQWCWERAAFPGSLDELARLGWVFNSPPLFVKEYGPCGATCGRPRPRRGAAFCDAGHQEYWVNLDGATLSFHGAVAERPDLRGRRRCSYHESHVYDGHEAPLGMRTGIDRGTIEPAD